MLQRIRLMLVVGLVVLAAGCNNTFVGIHVEGTMPTPLIRLDEGLTLSQFSIDKVEYTEDGDMKHTKYWGFVAKEKKQEKSFNVITYGQVPAGYQEHSKLRALDLGFYSVQMKALHTVAAGAFLVLEAENGNLSVTAVDKPYNYKDEVIRCFQKFSYNEREVISNCLTREWRK